MEKSVKGIDNIGIAHIAAGAGIAAIGKSPREAATIVLAVELLERSRYSEALPGVFRKSGPLFSDLIYTAAGYAIYKEFIR